MDTGDLWKSSPKYGTAEAGAELSAIDATANASAREGIRRDLINVYRPGRRPS
jgi:hypothetical protein